MLGKIRYLIQKTSRDGKLSQFYEEFERPVRVLDVGVLSLKSHKNSLTANYFLKTFRYPAEYYTGLAVEDMVGMADSYPGKRFVTYDGKIFPFENDSFDAVFCNAVIEHVGDENDQTQFLNEMMRVAKVVYFTTPNKWFPVETHTNVLFRHWSDDSFYAWCAKYRSNYSKRNLNLLGYADVRRILDKSGAGAWTIVKNRLLGWTMTFSVWCTSDKTRWSGRSLN